MNKETLQSIVDDLRVGRTPRLSPEDFPCFSAEALEGNQHVDPSYLDVVAASLTTADAPTFERALRAMDEGDLAWLGFKVVYDAAEAQANTDNEEMCIRDRDLSGAYAMVLASPDSLYAFRDPNGIRPVSYTHLRSVSRSVTCSMSERLRSRHAGHCGENGGFVSAARSFAGSRDARANV